MGHEQSGVRVRVVLGSEWDMSRVVLGSEWC